MLAAVYVGDGHLEVQARPVPTLEPREVLVEISHCGICGTDLHLVLERYARPGSVLGHEWSGTVVAVPDGDDAALLGRRVVQNPEPGCGTCRACHAGRPSVCRKRLPVDHLAISSGSFSRYRAVEARRLLILPDSLSSRAAALTEPTAIALHCVNLSGVSQADRVLITGGGPVGQLTAAVLKARGVTDITISEPSPVRRERALSLGVRRAIEPSDLPAARTGRVVDEPYDVVFECSGHADAITTAFDQLDTGGTFVFVGTGSKNPTINHNRAIILELIIIGAYNYDADGFASAIELLASGALALELLIEPEDIGLHQLETTLRQLASGRIAGKVLVQPMIGVDS